LYPSAARDHRPGKIPRIIHPQHNRKRRFRVVIGVGIMREEKTLESPRRIEVIAAYQAGVIDPASLRKLLVSLGSTIGGLKLPLLNMVKPRDTPLVST
jgi:hypothetical protein